MVVAITVGRDINCLFQQLRYSKDANKRLKLHLFNLLTRMMFSSLTFKKVFYD